MQANKLGQFKDDNIDAVVVMPVLTTTLCYKAKANEHVDHKKIN